jgi:hypothetical protein
LFNERERVRGRKSDRERVSERERGERGERRGERKRERVEGRRKIFVIIHTLFVVEDAT